MKNILAFFAVLLFISCSNPLSYENTETASTGILTIRIRHNNVRTLYPDLSFSRYELNLVRQEDAAVMEPVTVTHGIEMNIPVAPGTWTVIVTAYEETDGGEPLAEGSSHIKVDAGKNVYADIVLAPVMTGTGTFSYKVAIPKNLQSATLSLSYLESGIFVPAEEINLLDTVIGTIELNSGYYLMEIRLENAYLHTGLRDIIHIYPGQTTAAPLYSFDTDGVPVPKEIDPADTAGELKNYLDDQPENTVESPYPVIVTAIDLSTGTLQQIFGELSRYITLDLSDCTRNIFPPLILPDTQRVVSLKLPEITTVESATFSSITSLASYLNAQPENTAAEPYKVKITGVDVSKKSELQNLYGVLNRYVALDLTGCTGADIGNAVISTDPNMKYIVSLVFPDTVTLINNGRFKECNNLVSVEGSHVITIKSEAFSKCTALKSVYFPVVQVIEYNSESGPDGVFYGCSALSSVYIPEVSAIGNHIFNGCTALKTLVIPHISSLGIRALKGSGITTLTLGATPPNLKAAVFENVNPLPDIYVPDAAAVNAYQSANESTTGWTVALKAKVKALS
ncbi:hypothetical protein FACS1894164_03020 [Spirochaetia bacterium]|nr:hypothetical protein FACS1894164_03020 [Spirochaetia bacterium]